VVTIRRATDAERDAIWEVFHEVIAAGETYPLDPQTSREDALAYWFQRDAHVYVAELDRLNRSSSHAALDIVGSYSLHANQAGGGAHVANAAFIVKSSARGEGIGRTMANIV